MERTAADFINTINQTEHDGETVSSPTAQMEEYRVKTRLRIPLS